MYRRVGLAVIFLLSTHLGFASAQRLTTSEASLDEEHRAFLSDVRADLSAGRFERLDQRAAELIKTKARFQGGDWKLYWFYGAMHAPLERTDITDATWEQHIHRMEEWQRAAPRSTAAAIALAESWRYFAWRPRGTGYADTVTEQMAATFHSRLQRADEILSGAAEQAAQDPHWYCAMIQTGLGQAWPRSRINQLFSQAIAVEPHYLHTYFATAYYLLPRWYGDDGGWEIFVDHEAERLGGIEGAVMYSYVALEMSTLYRGRDFFVHNDIAWPSLHRAFEIREEAVGVNIRDLNLMAYLAVYIGDKATGRELFARIGDRWDADRWRERRYFDDSLAWAKR